VSCARCGGPLTEAPGVTPGFKWCGTCREFVSTADFVSPAPIGGGAEETKRRPSDRHAQRDEFLSTDEERPQIVTTNRHLHDIVNDAWDVIVRCNDPPVFFEHAGAIAEIGDADDERPVISHFSTAGFRGKLDRSADWMRETREGLTPARPPKDVIEDMEALPKPLPVLRGIIGTPVFSEQGKLVVEEGYQPETCLYYVPTGDAMPLVPDRPDATDLKRAKQLIGQEWLTDFPFLDDASRVNGIAAPITAIARELIHGPTPLFAIDSPSAGSGKSLLARGIGLISSGSEPAVMAEPRSDEELRKRVTSLLYAGASVLLFDNLKRRLESPVLAALLTATVWSDRILGRTQSIDLPNRSVWLATGNNIEMNDEIARRVAWIRIDAKMDRPWQRAAFRHDDLVVWMQRHRHELVWAFLVLVQNWIAQGRRPWSGSALGSFEQWSRVTGGILEAAAISGFLSNREELYKRADMETDEWRAFTSEWRKHFNNASVKVSDLIDIGQELLPTVFSRTGDNSSARSMKTTLGKAIAKHQDRGFGGLVIRRAGEDGHNGGVFWRVECHRTADVPPAEGPTSAQHPQENGPSSDTNADVGDVADMDSGLNQNMSFRFDAAQKNEKA
jgi:putative DNA primase/helicase